MQEHSYAVDLVDEQFIGRFPCCNFLTMFSNIIAKMSTTTTSTGLFYDVWGRAGRDVDGSVCGVEKDCVKQFVPNVGQCVSGRARRTPYLDDTSGNVVFIPCVTPVIPVWGIEKKGAREKSVRLPGPQFNGKKVTLKMAPKTQF